MLGWVHEFVSVRPNRGNRPRKGRLDTKQQPLSHKTFKSTYMLLYLPPSSRNGGSTWEGGEAKVRPFVPVKFRLLDQQVLTQLNLELYSKAKAPAVGFGVASMWPSRSVCPRLSGATKSKANTKEGMRPRLHVDNWSSRYMPQPYYCPA